MAIISRETATEKLSPFFDMLAEIPYDAFDSWRANPMAAYAVSRSVERMGVWNEMVRFAEERFEGIPRVKWVKLQSKQRGLLVDGQIFIRFKKSDARLRSSNYPTLTALNFHDQDVDLCGALYRLEVVYVLDKRGLNIDSVFLVQRHKGRIVLDIELERNAARAANVIPFSPIQPTLEDTDSAAHIIKQPNTGNDDDTEFKDTGGGA